MAGSHPKLTTEQWNKQRVAIKKASKKTRAAIEAWAIIAASTVNGNPVDEWRWLLADLLNRCRRDKDRDVECPYTVTYLVQLAETHTKVEADWDRGVSPSVLIEGRKLPNLLDIVEQEKEENGDLSVSRIKAYVSKKANKDKRSVDEIEEEMKAKQDDVKERKTRRRQAEKIEGWSPEKSDDLLPMMREQITAFRSATMRLRSKGKEFDPTEIDLTLDAAQQLVTTLEEMRRSGLSVAA